MATNNTPYLDFNEFIGIIRSEVGFDIKPNKVIELSKRPDVQVKIGKSGGGTNIDRADFMAKLPKIVEILKEERDRVSENSMLGNLRYNAVPRAMAQILLEENDNLLFGKVVDQINFNLRSLRRSTSTYAVTGDLEAFTVDMLKEYLHTFLMKEANRQKALLRGKTSQFRVTGGASGVSSTGGGRQYVPPTATVSTQQSASPAPSQPAATGGTQGGSIGTAGAPLQPTAAGGTQGGSAVAALSQSAVADDPPESSGSVTSPPPTEVGSGDEEEKTTPS